MLFEIIKFDVLLSLTFSVHVERLRKVHKALCRGLVCSAVFEVYCFIPFDFLESLMLLEVYVVWSFNDIWCCLKSILYEVWCLKYFVWSLMKFDAVWSLQSAEDGSWKETGDDDEFIKPYVALCCLRFIVICVVWSFMLLWGLWYFWSFMKFCAVRG